MTASISAEHYEFIRQLVYQHSRINLGQDKMELVRGRVQKRLRQLGLTDFQSYCQLLDSREGEAELTELLDVISTNVTHFFREWEHFRFLKEVALPVLTGEKKRALPGPLRVWSAACSSGQEPYSIAILLSEFFKHGTENNWHICASDISTRMLEAARQGIYRSEQIKMPSANWLSDYFQIGTGVWEGYHRVKRSLKDRVEVRHLNLFSWPYVWPTKFHIIFCRNVMIYFDRSTQEQLISHLAAELEPGGYLVVGHSESLVGFDHGLKSLRPSVYQRVNAGVSKLVTKS